MSDYYVLRDIENRDDSGAPWETESHSLAGFIPYVDGPLRSDIANPEGRDTVEEAIGALRRENFHVAQALLRELGVYIRLEAGDPQ